MKLHRVKILSAFIFILIRGNLLATNYFVSSSGDDNNSGLDPEHPWATISRVNNQAFQAGDSIFFRRGDTWREQLSISHSGEEGNHITYTSYGSGNRPRLLGSIPVSNWEPTGVENIWQSTDRIPNRPMNYDNNGTVCFEYNDTTKQGYYMITYDGSFTGLDEEFEWMWNDETLYIYSPEDPDTRYSSVEAMQIDEVVTLLNNNTSQYITMDGLTIRYGRERCIMAGYPTQNLHGLEIRSCELAYTGRIESSSAYGILTCFSDLIIEDCLIHDHGRRGISYTSYRGIGTTFSNIHIRNNRFYNGYHSTSLDLQLAADGPTPDTVNGFYFYNNHISNDTSHMLQIPYGSNANDIFVQSGDAVINNVFIYNNVVKGSKSRALLVNGVGCDTIYIANNTFYGFNKEASPWGQVSTRSTGHVYFVNNICYGDLSVDEHAAMNLMAEETNTEFIARDYNLYHQVDGRQALIYDRIVGGVEGEGDMSWAEYIALDQFDQNSPEPQDPQFIGGYNNLQLTSGSPAVEAGTSIPWIGTDILGNPRDPVNPCIGAYEYINSDPGFAKIVNMTVHGQIGIPVFDHDNRTILVQVIDYTDVTSLAPAFVLNKGASISPASGIARDFSDPLVYILTAPDEVTEVEYTITIEVAENEAPVASNVTLVGNPYIDSVLTLEYDYSDFEGDAEGNTVFRWYVNDQLSTNNQRTYVLSSNDSACMIYGTVTPVAQLGELTGEELSSNTVGPVVPYHIKLVTAEIGSYSDSIVRLVFDSQLLSSNIPEASDFTIIVDGETQSIEEVRILGNTVFLSLGASGSWGDEISFSYQRGSIIMEDDNGYQVLSMADILLENNIETNIAENLFLWSEVIDNEAWVKMQNTIVYPNRHNDLEGEFTMDSLVNGGEPNRMIIVGQQLVGYVEPNTTYTLAFDVHTDNPSDGGNGWRAEVNENQGTNVTQFLWGDSVMPNVITRLEFEFTTQPTTNRITVLPISRWSPNWSMNIGRVHLYRGIRGAKRYIETEGAQIIDRTVEQALSSNADILSFTIPGQVNSRIDEQIREVLVTLPYGSSLTNLTPEIIISNGAQILPDDGQTQNFESVVTYTVTSEDGENILDWRVNVEIAEQSDTVHSSEIDIEYFTIDGQESSIINEDEYTIFVTMPYGTILSNLIPDIAISEGAEISPLIGTAQDFTSPVEYTVTAENKVDSQVWTVTVTEAPSNEAEILTFSFAQQTGAAEISSDDQTISIEVAYGTDLTNIIPHVSVSEGAAIDTANVRNFSIGVTLTITAEDESTKAWVVAVTEAPSNEAEILAFSFVEQTGDAKINSDAQTISIEVAYGTDLSNLIPYVMVSDEATVDTAGIRDFSTDVILTIIAEDDTEKEWVVTVIAGEGSAVSEVISNSLRIMPNPASEYIEVNSASDIDVVDLTIINCTGQILQKETSINTGTRVSLNDMVPGLYFIQISNGNNLLSTQKLIVE